jgi:hypothetical protein
MDLSEPSCEQLGFVFEPSVDSSLISTCEVYIPIATISSTRKDLTWHLAEPVKTACM